LDSVHDAGAEFYLYIDSAEDAERYRDMPVDGIVTDYIEVIGPYYRE
jgi:hypothetical protein